jgi:hypothetical protein
VGRVCVGCSWWVAAVVCGDSVVSQGSHASRSPFPCFVSGLIRRKTSPSLAYAHIHTHAFPRSLVFFILIFSIKKKESFLTDNFQIRLKDISWRAEKIISRIAAKHRIFRVKFSQNETNLNGARSSAGERPSRHAFTYYGQVFLCRRTQRHITVCVSGMAPDSPCG